jgi:hypothetical protein
MDPVRGFVYDVSTGRLSEVSPDEGTDPSRVLLFLHGGGYELGSVRNDGELAAWHWLRTGQGLSASSLAVPATRPAEVSPSPCSSPPVTPGRHCPRPPP